MSPRLSPLPPAKIEKKLKRLGFGLDKVDGSCRFWKRTDKAGLVWIVQVHDHPVDKGLDVITAILRNGGISREDWLSV
jgi:predicted RNA binding protein YcfA (HicA-like mRNA interferase family)